MFFCINLYLFLWKAHRRQVAEDMNRVKITAIACKHTFTLKNIAGKNCKFTCK